MCFWEGRRIRGDFGSLAAARYERTRMPFVEKTRTSHVLAIFPTAASSVLSPL